MAFSQRRATLNVLLGECPSPIFQDTQDTSTHAITLTGGYKKQGLQATEQPETALGDQKHTQEQPCLSHSAAKLRTKSADRSGTLQSLKSVL